jgi:16S rRNA (adenine1518-N6/adenine1519-N6)-dimethyltransferase
LTKGEKVSSPALFLKGGWGGLIKEMLNAFEIKKLCEELGIVPTKSKGQNFLIDKNILDKIIAAADLKKSDTVLEVGPGLGVLTEELLKRVQKVFAVELDKKLFERLSVVFKNNKNLKIYNADILQFEICNLKFNKVVANLPYQITSAVIRKFLENEIKPELIVLMVQKEVAERICTRSGDMGLLSVSVQFYGKPEIVSKVSKNSFWPVPKVDSAILKITPIKREKINEEKFFRIVRAGFAHPRKQLRRNLADGLNLPVKKIDKAILSAKLNPKIRAEELEVEDWIKIMRII